MVQKTVSFNINDPTDASGTVRIGWGDGSSDTVLNNQLFDGVTVISSSHEYSTDGTYTITVTATDAGSLSGSSTISVTVGSNSAPVVNLGISNQTAVQYQNWSFTIPSDAFSDPDNDTLSYRVENMIPDIVFDGTTGTFSGSPSFYSSFQFTVYAEDPAGESVSTTFILVVDKPDDPPTVINEVINQ